MPSENSLNWKFTLVAVAALSVAFQVQAAWFRSTKSITFDETYYLSCGLQSAHDRSLDPRIAGEGVAPLPILLTYVVPLSIVGGEDRPEPWEGQSQDARLIEWPRIVSSFLFGISLISLSFIWIYRRRGPVAAIVGGTLAAFSPTLLAHASLATTDACFAVFGTLGIAATAAYFCEPTRFRFVVMAIATAAAMTAKYSGVFLLPVAGIMLFFNANTGSEEPLTLIARVRVSVKTFVIFLSLVVPIWWGLHLFTFTGPLKNVPLEETPDFSPWVQMLGRGPWAERIMDVSHTTLKRPAPVAGVVFQYLHNNSGHGSFLMGRHKKTGWWYFFPCAFAFKSTPSELVLSGFLIGLALSGLRAPRRAWGQLDTELQVMLLSVVVFTGMLMSSNINIGQRYLILLYPLIIIAGVDRVAVHLKKHAKLLALTGCVLVLGQVGSCLFVAPNYLAYFNAFSGGPEEGSRLLVDSSIDWGQDLPALERELEGTLHQRTALCYFGTAVPEAYGVDCDRIDDLTGPVASYEQLAISASCLQGAYVRGGDPFGAFRSFTPDARAGFSIFMFELDTPEKRQAFADGIQWIDDSIAADEE